MKPGAPTAFVMMLATLPSGACPRAEAGHQEDAAATRSESPDSAVANDVRAAPDARGNGIPLECPAHSDLVGGYPPQACTIGCQGEAGKTGLWTYFHSSGQKVLEVEYRDGKRHGRWRQYDHFGKPTVEGAFSAGRKHGLWKWNFAKGNVVDEEYHEGLNLRPRSGVCPAGSEVVGGPPPSALAQWCETPEGKRVGPSSSWEALPDGRFVKTAEKVTSHDGATASTWFPDGRPKSEARWKGDVPVSRKEWHFAGALASTIEYRSGLPWKETTWHENGRVASEKLHLDGRVEQETHWNETGRKALASRRVNGLLDGVYTRWHENGRKALEGRFVMGWPDGAWARWSDAGQKIGEAIYKRGTLISGKGVDLPAAFMRPPELGPRCDEYLHPD